MHFGGGFQPVSGGAGLSLGPVSYSLPVSGVLSIGQTAEAGATITAAANTVPGTYTYQLTINYEANGAKSRTVPISVMSHQARRENRCRYSDDSRRTGCS